MILHLLLSLVALWVIWYVILPYLRYLRFTRYSGLPADIYIYPYLPFIGSWVYNNQSRKEGTHLQYTKHFFGKLGPSCRAAVTNMGPKNMVLLTDPAYIQDFYRQPQFFQKWQGISTLLTFIAGRGLLLQEGQDHRRDRGIIAQAFSFRFLSQSAHQINSTIVSKLDSIPDGPFVLYDYLTDVTSTLLLQLFLGAQQVNQKVNGRPLALAVAKQFSEFAQVFTSPGYLILGRLPKETRDLTAAIQEACVSIVKESIKKSNQTQKRDHIIGRLCSMKLIDDEESLNNVVAQFKSFLIGGTDTTATLLSWCLYFLTENPEIHQKLRAQACSFDPELAPLTASSGTAECPLIDGYIKQILRIHGPINTIITRQAMQDVILDDLFVPKGTTVSVLHEYNHCHESNFVKPFEIRPERWINGQTDNLKPFTYVPFSAGSRNCIGQHLATLQARLILINFLRKYSFQVQQPFKPIADPDNNFDFFKLPLKIKVTPLNY